MVYGQERISTSRDFQLGEMGATQIVVHLAMPDQLEVIDFFGKKKYSPRRG